MSPQSSDSCACSSALYEWSSVKTRTSGSTALISAQRSFSSSFRKIRSTGRWWASISSRSCSGTKGRSSPLRWRIFRSLSTPTTSTSPISFALARYFTCPRWIRSNEPDVSTIRWPRPLRFATRSAIASREGTSRSSKLTPGPRMPLVIAMSHLLPRRPSAHAELDRPRRVGLERHEVNVQMSHAPSVVAHVPAALDRRDGHGIEPLAKRSLQGPEVGAGLVRQLVERRHVLIRHDQIVGACPLVRVVVLDDVPVLAGQLDRGAVLLRAEDAHAGSLQLVHVAALVVA